MTMPAPPTPGVEMSIKEILDSAWVRRFGRLSMIVLPFIISIGGSAIGWVIYQNYMVSTRAEATAAKAATIAADVQDVQDERAALTDQRAKDEEAWRRRLDIGLTSLSSRVTTLIGEVGQLKGIVIRESNSVTWTVPHPAGLFSGGEVDIAGDLTQEDR